jgi:hypothetical protein
MDIEGYEIDVISKGTDIVKDADIISIELHNAIVDGANPSFIRALRQS